MTLYVLYVICIAFSARYSLYVLMCRKTHITHSLVFQTEGERKLIKQRLISWYFWCNGSLKQGGGGVGWRDGLGKLPVPGVLLIWNRVGQGPTALACSRCGLGLFGHFFSYLSCLCSFSLSLGDGPI